MYGVPQLKQLNDKMHSKFVLESVHSGSFPTNECIPAILAFFVSWGAGLGSSRNGSSGVFCSEARDALSGCLHDQPSEATASICLLSVPLASVFPYKAPRGKLAGQYGTWDVGRLHEGVQL